VAEFRSFSRSGP